MRNFSTRLLTLLLPLLLFRPAPAPAQQPAGVVTALRGEARVGRPALSQPLPLKFKDDVFVRDRIETQENAIVRVLLGGKAVVTVRELSTFTITEEPGRAVVDLQSGKLALGVAKSLLRPGESIEVRTPNAVAAVRGSLLVTTVAILAGVPQTTFTALGVSLPILVSTLAAPTVAIPLTTNSSMGVSGIGAATTTTPVQTLTAAQAGQAARDAQAPGPTEQRERAPEPLAALVSENKGQEAAQLAGFLAPLNPGGASPATPATPDQSLANASSAATTPPGSSSPPVPPPPPTTSTSDVGVQATAATQASSQTASSGTQTNRISNPGFETGDLTNWTLSGAGSVVASLGSFSPPEGSYQGFIHTGTGAANNTTSTLTQSFRVGSVLLITFKYNFLSNEYPTQPTTFNDFFEAKLIDSADTQTQLALESRNSSSFTLSTQSMSAGGFTLLSGRGYTGFKNVSRTVVASSGTATLSFTVEDVGDTNVDSAALIDLVSVTQDPPLYLLRDGQTLTRPRGEPLLEVSDQALTVDSVLLVCCPGPGGRPSSATLGGPVLKATRSAVTVPFSLLGLLGSGTLTTTSADPLVWLEEGTHALSTVPGTAIFDVWGIATAPDAATGLPVGTDRPLQHAGPLLEASGATVTTEKLLKLDTALLEASAPLLNLRAGSTFTTSADAVDLSMRAKVTSLGPLVSLDASALTVARGALVALDRGSVLNVTGDLIRLSNGSTVNLLNGPLLSVSGGSVLNVSGALATFTGTGGNRINVTNSLCPCQLLSGIPVAFQNGALASNVSIGPNPIKNPGLGTLSLSNSSLGSGGTAVIAVSGSTSKVTIGAP